jgi:hypothetical protein
MAKPSLLKRDVWGNHEKRVLKIFSLALQMLRDESCLPKEENELNRKLYFLVKRANTKLSESNLGINSPCWYEANNQPDVDDIMHSKREDKRPDFQWGICDTNETNPDRMDKFYVLEAKRLGSPSSRKWILNENYIFHGIKRFILPEWGYSKSMSSGAMIGYVQDMELDDILNQVNDYASKEEIAKLSLSSDAWNEDINRLEHQLERPEIEPSIFDLRHIWVDLRHHY